MDYGYDNWLASLADASMDYVVPADTNMAKCDDCGNDTYMPSMVDVNGLSICQDCHFDQEARKAFPEELVKRESNQGRLLATLGNIEAAHRGPY